MGVCAAHVRFWPKADICFCNAHVRPKWKFSDRPRRQRHARAEPVQREIPRFRTNLRFRLTEAAVPLGRLESQSTALLSCVELNVAAILATVGTCGGRSRWFSS
jgi:hypothetical protein